MFSGGLFDAQPDNDRAYSVGEINVIIRDLIAADDRLRDVWIRGEISEGKLYDSGHYYFTLKDVKTQLKSVMWRTDAMRQNAMPRNGELVLAHGKIDVYSERGLYQFYADRFRPVGVGDLFAELEQLKDRLRTEGLFDAERKRPLPLYPARIGVVTSVGAAAWQDVLNVLRRRFPVAQVIVSHTLVQGIDAPSQIARAIRRLNEYGAVDVILVTRGGGSIEDLWAFNDERVARAAADSLIPVISGVGHETDTTLIDYAADVRAPTPSAAAEMMTPDLGEYRVAVAEMTHALTSIMTRAISDRRAEVEGETRTLARLSPEARIDRARQRIDDGTARMSRALAGRLALQRERLDARQAALSAANPRELLARGYAIVTDTRGARVTRADEAPPGSRVRVRFYDGARDAVILLDEKPKA